MISDKITGIVASPVYRTSTPLGSPFAIFSYAVRPAANNELIRYLLELPMWIEHMTLVLEVLPLN